MPLCQYRALLILALSFAFTHLYAEESLPPEVVRRRDFQWAEFNNPDPIFWPAYFWLWNGPLEPDVLKRQLQDMAGHDARNVCVLPMPRDFRPDSTANRMDVDYLSPEYFQKVKIAVDEAARLGMHYWLYDEGGWPSGQATGRVVSARPDLGLQVMQPASDGRWEMHMSNGRPDLLNPETTATFIDLTHEKYRDVVGSHLGKTIRLVFTDEPAYPAVQEGRVVPWTTGADELFARRFSYRLSENLTSAFRRAAASEYSADELRVRMDAFDFWSSRFHDAYFDPLRDWCRRHGEMAHGGHIGGEDETLGAVRYGFGHVMRQMRGMDVPGVDIIWRQVFPGKRNHHFPKFASSAAHQNGTSLALTESFCVYGNGLTPAQMKWLVDYQYIRGLNLLVAGCYPLSTEDHHMLGERPHFGPVDPLWDFLPRFHRYVASIGYLLSCGEPVVDTALYYPVRDLWATGSESLAAVGHDELAQSLFEHQVDFDIIDDDLLSDPASKVADGRLIAGKISYRTIVVGPEEQMLPASRERLKELESSGGQVIRVERLEEISRQVAQIRPTIQFTPSGRDLRCQLRRWQSGGVAMIFNEGAEPSSGRVSIPLSGHPYRLEPESGHLFVIADASRDEETCTFSFQLGGGESQIILFDTDRNSEAQPKWKSTKRLALDSGWEARPVRRHIAGVHDFEIKETPDSPFHPLPLGSWDSLVSDDFSGRVEYKLHVKLPDDWQGQRLRLDLGRVDYAARVRINGNDVGTTLWSPWIVEWTRDPGDREFELSIEVANTLANELTSQRLQEAWAKRSGPGWPGPYHQRALDFEKESRSGGLFGPVKLEME